MNFCYKCGKQLNDEVDFCPNCGTKQISISAIDTTKNIEFCSEQKTSIPPRQSMRAWAVFCFILAGIYTLMAITGSAATIFSATTFLSVLGCMFLVLSKSPKDNKFILGKDKGIKKVPFILISIAVAFFLFMFITQITSH